MASVRSLTDGAKDASVEVVLSFNESGLPWQTVIDVSALKNAPARVRIDEIFYAISEGAEVRVAWHHEGGARHEFLPLSGRGRMPLPDMSSPATEGLSGDIEVRVIGGKPDGLAFLLFDLMKQ